MLAVILQIVATALEIFSKSGGPEAINRWLNDKAKELQAIKVTLTPPEEP